MKININETKFLKKDIDIKHKGIVELVNEGAWEESQKFKRDDGTPAQLFNIILKLENGEERSTVLNWTNVKLLVQGFGDETSQWVGKRVRAWKTKSEKAKSGYTFIFVPTDWNRDDTGEWILPEGVIASEDIPEDGEEVIDPKDIPF